MGYTYKGAPGCNFKPSKFKNDIQRHLKRKTWCACKEADWNVDKAREVHKDGRSFRYSGQNVVNNGSGSVNNSNNNVNINVNINVSPGATVFPSGSDAERSYLQEHAETIFKKILAETIGPEADILSRFVQETWCSREHEKLNNVLSLTSQGHEYIVLRMRGGQPQIETFAGRDAPQQLVQLAQKVMHQFAVDSCKGYDPSQLTMPDYGMTCDTEAEALALNEKAGRGTVCQMKVWGSSERHKNQFDTFWVNRVDVNEKPKETPSFMQEADQVAGVNGRLLARKNDRKRLEKVICCQLRNVDGKRDKKQKLMAATT